MVTRLVRYSSWPSSEGKAQPYTYGTQTTGTVTFANVQLLNSTDAGRGVRVAYTLDADKTSLTIAAAFPVATAFPTLPTLSSAANITTGVCVCVCVCV